MEEEEVTYQRDVKERSKEIRKMEKEGLKLHKQRKRDVAKFRGHLVDLTTKLDDLTSLHGAHARTLLRDSQETSVRIVESSSSLVRAEVDIFEALARKGWTGGGLDELLEKGKDLFANEEEEHHEGNGATSKLFSILPQKSILADSEAGKSGPARADSLVIEGDRYQSLAGAVGRKEVDESGSIFSVRAEGNFNKSRGVRPFSPPPLTRVNLTQETLSPLDDAFGKAASTKTVVRADDKDAESSADATKESSQGDEQRGRLGERRWSVTDDGNPSE